MAASATTSSRATDRDRAGLYRPGFGGVRLEDIAIVTDDGVEVVTDYRTSLEP